MGGGALGLVVDDDVGWLGDRVQGRVGDGGTGGDVGIADVGEGLVAGLCTGVGLVVLEHPADEGVRGVGDGVARLGQGLGLLVDGWEGWVVGGAMGGVKDG